MKKYLLVLLVILFTGSMNLYSQEKKPEFKPEIKIGGTFYAGWTYNADDADFIGKLDTAAATGPNSNSAFGFNPIKNQFETGKNSFNIDRAYINIRASLTPQINARITPDITSVVDQSGVTQWTYQLKYGFVDYTPLALDNGTSLTMEVGVLPNYWINNIEKYYGWRGVQKTLTDYSWTMSATRNGNTVTRKTASYFSSADLGLTMKFTFPSKIADLTVALLNGNGYKNLAFDQNRFKDFMVTGFIYPLAGQIKQNMEAAKKMNKTRIDGIADLTVGGFAYMGKLGSNEYGVLNGGSYANNRFGGMANFKYNFKNFGYVKLGGEFSLQSNKIPVTLAGGSVDSSITAQGISTWFEFNPPVEAFQEKLMLTFRYDSFNPNTTKPGTNLVGFTGDANKQTLMIVGLMFKPASVLTLGLNYQIQSFDKDYIVKYDGTTKSSISRLYFNTILEF
ncbi:MAG: hypothetical protein PHN88_11425 [Ignavibacteria bacterium]|nr:hypothetical protein [Ignavibacteria bacterium]